MKKLSLFLFLLLSTVMFIGCSDDDKEIVEDELFITKFEGKLASANSEFISESKEEEGYYFVETFEDNEKLVSFKHLYTWGDKYYFASFTYMNITDNSDNMSTAAITKKGKNGSTYLCAYTSEFAPATFTINDPEVYKIDGAWITNSTQAYNAMTTGDISGPTTSTPFKKGDSFKLTAIGYKSDDTPAGKAEIYLANYKSGNEKPVNEWIWFDMTPLKNAVRVEFLLESTDNNSNGMLTPAYFCMDAITLKER